MELSQVPALLADRAARAQPGLLLWAQSPPHPGRPGRAGSCLSGPTACGCPCRPWLCRHRLAAPAPCAPLPRTFPAPEVTSSCWAQQGCLPKCVGEGCHTPPAWQERRTGGGGRGAPPPGTAGCGEESGSEGRALMEPGGGKARGATSRGGEVMGAEAGGGPVSGRVVPRPRLLLGCKSPGHPFLQAPKHLEWVSRSIGNWAPWVRSQGLTEPSCPPGHACASVSPAGWRRWMAPPLLTALRAGRPGRGASPGCVWRPRVRCGASTLP